MRITANILQEIYLVNSPLFAVYAEYLNKMLPKYGIEKQLEICAFLAQVGHESNRMRVTEENLNYSAEGLLKVFPKYFRDVDPKSYARNPEKIASRVYANRMGNGDEGTGDGYRYRGRGLIQLTGKSNYTSFANSSKVDVVNNPDLLREPQYAVQCACWYWLRNDLNKFVNDFQSLTKKINGGLNGYDDRLQLFYRAKEILL